MSKRAIGRRAFTGGLLAVASCGHGDKLAPATRDFLLAATTFELVAVHPAISTPTAKPPGETEILHRHGVLGRAKVDAADVRSEMADLIDLAIGAAGSGAASCFKPRHAVSATRGDRRVDILICFECSFLEVWDGGAKPVVQQIGRAGESRMSEIFVAHGLTIAGK